MRTLRCSSCLVEVPADGRFCLNCGAPLHRDATTQTPPPAPAVSPTPSNASGRFTVGGILGERFRVLGLLGRGGMGEVYRAHDLKLDQQVALKFLPPAATRDANLVDRFRAEVRIARQISHRNVCRVYDLGEVDGAPYISMEYVDGEDLGSLLRRIGRLPGDKALEFARRMCAGLAAAHDKGVLHRDLKPANVMVDGRGQVLIMDFGLAAVADAVAGADSRSGTPAYMAPEQREGREVTVRSDIFSLGMVLAEMFTGQRPSPEGKLSSTTRDLDPAVEKVLQRCLDPDPGRRFESSIDVARALPGGDPLAEALAAGDTPSPEMVAASDNTGILSVRAAVLCLAVVLVGVVGNVVMGNRTNPVQLLRFPDSPELMARTARNIAATAGYTAGPTDRAYGFATREGLGNLLLSDPEARKLDDYDGFVTNSSTSRIQFWYREGPLLLVPLGNTNAVTHVNPPRSVTGMVSVYLDTEGRLTSFLAVPPRGMSSQRGAPADWTALFKAAGLDPANWTPVEPVLAPPTNYDEQAAWTGSFPHAPSVELRIDAAAWRGWPVQFEIRRPATRSVPRDPPVMFLLAPVLAITALLLVAGLLAYRNYSRGRGDWQGAQRLALVAMVCTYASWLLSSEQNLSNIRATANLLTTGLNVALFSGAALWMLYVALEPHVRRLWPQSLISWTRLLDGRLNDPVVGGHVLLGIALGAIIAFTNIARFGAPADISTVNWMQRLPLLSGPRRILAAAAEMLPATVAQVLLLFLLFFLVRAISRSVWAAVIIVASVAGSLGYLYTPGGDLAIRFAIMATVGTLVALRFGILSIIAAQIAGTILRIMPHTTDLSDWYASSMITALAVVVGAALWSFRVAIGGRNVLNENFLER